MIKRLILLLFLTIFLVPATSHAEHIYNDKDGYHYFFDKSSGFYLRLDNPKSNNISTNIIDDLTFTVLWYNKDKTQPNFGYNGIAYGTFDLSTKAPHVTITKERYHQVYTIHGLDTKLTKTKTGFKVPIEIKNDDSSDKSLSNFKGESGKIDIELNYYQVDHDNAKLYTDFKAGTDMKMFGDKLMLRFPANSFISDSSLSGSILLDQKVAVTVIEKPQPTKDLVFLSQQFIVDDANKSLYAKPSTWGDITLKYEGVVPKAMEGYNLTVLKNNYGKWVPIGGVVDPVKKTVTSIFDDFGTYAIGLVYKDYGLKQSWAKKEVLGLAYKGVIQPDINKKDLALLSNLNKPIDRFTYTVLLSRALGFQPLDYTGVFSDVNNIDYSQNDLGYLMAGVMNGLVFGKESNVTGYMVMEPKKTLTREEAVAFLARAITLGDNQGTSSTSSKFTKKKKGAAAVPESPKTQLKKVYKDANKISDWAASAVLQATNAKLVNAPGGNFNPKGKLTNAEAMSMIYKLMEAKKLK